VEKDGEMTRFVFEFEYEIGERVEVPGLETFGFVTSLWYSDRGPQYEVAYYADGKRTREYFFPQELRPEAERKTGYR